MSRNDICATCEHFGVMDHPEQAAHGMGRCNGFDGHVAPVVPFVRWDARTCILYGKAKDIGKRDRWISAQKLRTASDGSGGYVAAA